MNSGKTATLSTWMLSVMLLLTLLAFSNSVSSGSGYKPADRESVSTKNPARKRQISFQHGRQFLLYCDLIRSADQNSKQFSLVHHSKTLAVRLNDSLKRDIKLPELSELTMLHAPRSSDLIIPPNRG